MVPQLTAATDVPVTDVSVSFLINDGAFRGRFVRLTGAVTEIQQRHDDPAAVGALLAEALVSAIALAGGLKYDGVFTLQVQGDGPVHMLIADVTSDGHVRACAKFDAERLATEMGRTRPGNLPPHLLGAGHLAFTVDQGPDTERYQGIVELSGDKLSESVHRYFRQSEQLESALKVAIGAPAPGAGGPWSAAALLIQRMPEEGAGRSHIPREDLEDDWRAAVILLGSMKDAELLDPSLAPLQVVHRAYGSVGARLVEVRPIAAVCRCSRAKSSRILASFPIEEVRNLSDHGAVRMTCEFCRSVYTFTLEELESVARESRPSPQETGDPS